jgi:hypothetical protein
MILKGSQRSGALKLAAHLLRQDENDHVEVHELRGFLATDLHGALQEASAIAKGTKCRQFLFSLSFNPPETERVTVAQFEAAIDRAEERLGLGGQARAIVFHEKEGRRHAHVVWSRIKVEEMKAINLPFYKRKLNGLAKELYLEHGWRLPDGFRDRANRNPLNFSQSEWQQAKRVQADAVTLKMTFQECLSVSDNRAAFEQALTEKGFVLARGDRRGFVAVDYRGETYSLSRWTGEKAKALKDKLGDPASLRDVETVKDEIAGRMTDKLKSFIKESEASANIQSQAIQQRKAGMKADQQGQRQELQDHQKERAIRESVERAARFRTGVRGLWDWVTGKTRTLKRQNEEEAVDASKRDANEQEKLISTQLAERRLLQQELRQTRREATTRMEDLRLDVAFYMGWHEGAGTAVKTADRKDLRRHDHELGM